MNQNTGNALIVLARFPAAGRGKTRLAAAIGAKAAAAISRAFLEDIRSRFDGDHRWTLWWAFEPADSPFAAEIARSSRAFPQPEGSLGDRMAEAIESLLSRGYRNVVLVGSDIPHLPLEVVEDAFVRLGRGADLVLGPAEDGGYYLIGTRSVPPVFDAIPWSQKLVLEKTIERARSAGIEPELLSPLYDIDGPEDLERLRRELRGKSVAGLAATRAALETVRTVGYK